MRAFEWWDPAVSWGYPVYANPSSQAFYPLKQIAPWLGEGWWVAAHLLVGGLLALALLRRLGSCWPIGIFGGAVFSLCVYATQTPQGMCAASWLPLVWRGVFELSVEVRARWIALTALACALVALAGSVEAGAVVLGSGLALGLVLIPWNGAGHIAGLLISLLWAGMISLVQIGPALELRANSRGTELARTAAIREVYLPDAERRFWIARETKAAGSLPDALQLMRDSEYDPSRTAIVEGPPAEASGGEGTVRLIREQRESIEIELDTDGPAFLASSEAMYPGWKASVDGIRVTLRYTNGAFRGLSAPQGRHTVKMWFEPVNLKVYAVASGAALLLALYYCVARAREKSGIVSFVAAGQVGASIPVS